MTVPVNLKESDAFHLTIEEYLLGLISMVEELVSLSASVCYKLMLTDTILGSSGS